MARSVAARRTEIELGACDASELLNIVAMLDREFVLAKGRRLSLATRFPGVLCAGNARNVLVARGGGEVVSVLAIAHFDWVVCERLWRGAMIGMVYTDPAWRGHGLASQLLRMAESGFMAERLDFGVLWTNKPGFYARHGWVLADSGYLGSLSLDSPRAEAGGAICTQDFADKRAWIESMRQQWRSKRVLRGTAGYQRLPLPSESLEVAVVNGGARQAYALTGRCEDTVYLYEMVGHPQCFPDLWRAVTRLGERVLINETCGSAAGKWLRCHTRASWQVQRQALWRPLSDRARAAPLDEWHIPYFDRI